MNRSAIVMLVFALSGCCRANVTVLPKEGGTGQAIATAKKERCALEKAQEEAEEHCKKQGKRYVAVNTDSSYQGADPNAKLALSAITGRSGNTNEDYRVQLDFKCE